MKRSNQFIIGIAILANILIIGIMIFTDNGIEYLALGLVAVVGVVLTLSRPVVGSIIVICLPIFQVSLANLPFANIISSVVGFMTIAAYIATNLNLRLTTNNKGSSLILPPIFLSILFLISTLLSSYFAQTINIRTSVTYVQLTMLVFLVIKLFNTYNLRWLHLSFIVSTLVAVLPTLTTANLTGSIHTSVRNVGLNGNSNELAMYIVLSMLSVASLLRIKNRIWQVSLIFIAIPMLLLGIVTTLSRTGAAALFFVLGSIVFYLPNIFGTYKKYIWLPRISAFLIGLFLLLLFVPDTYWSTLNEGFTGILTQQIDQQDSLYKRQQIWDVAIDVWLQFPLFGVGIGNSPELVGRVIHNGFLSILVETGLIGFVLYLMLIGYSLYLLFNLSNHSTNKEIRSQATVFMIMGVALCIVMLTNSFQYFKHVWFIFGIAEGLHLADRQTHEYTECGDAAIKSKGNFTTLSPIN